VGHLSDVSAVTIGRVDVDLGLADRGEVLAGFDWCVLRLSSNHEAQVSCCEILGELGMCTEMVDG
jgi:hypothetical protein